MTDPTHRSWSQDQSGAATPLSLMLGVGLIVLPVLALVLTLPTWEQRTVDAQDMARNAARTLVTADSWQTGIDAANQTVDDISTGDGLTSADVSSSYSGSLTAGGTVTVSVTITIPAGVLPGLGTIGTMHYTATSTEHVDSYRDSGL
jgi:hypothetical protein